MDTQESQQTQEFIVLFANHQRNLLKYLITIVHNLHDAEDLLQQSALVLWQKFDTFEQGTDFLRWACRISYLTAMNFLRTKRLKSIYLSEELLGELAAKQLDRLEKQDRYREYLPECLGKLSQKDREFVQMCYVGAGNFSDIAARIGRTADSVYHSLHRIRRALFNCVQRAIAQEG
jgi:RNA polymerase sigma-70 factor, ECF subfamily